VFRPAPFMGLNDSTDVLIWQGIRGATGMGQGASSEERVAGGGSMSFS
jgi:hypothetical protein